METCLIVCPYASGLAALARCRSSRPMIVASDDARVIQIARDLPGVTNVVPLELEESFWTVAADVKSVLARLEAWLSSLDSSLSPQAVTWAGTIEGGLLGQRVQDALLLIRSYERLILGNNVREVQAVVDPSGEWDAGVLVSCTRALRIPIVLHRVAPMRSRLRRTTRRLAPFAKALYIAWREVSLGAGDRVRASVCPELNDAIVFQLCSSARKHVDNVRFLMAALMQNGRRAIALCWAAGERGGTPSAQAQLKGAGLEAVGVERFTSIPHAFSSAVYCTVLCRRARRRRQELDTLTYQGVPLSPALDESLRHFLVAVLPARLRYARALETCLAGARPAVIKPWGGDDMYEGRLMLRLTAGSGAQYLNYWVGASFPAWPYSDIEHAPDIFLAKSEAEASIAKAEYGIDDRRVHVVGQPRWTHARSFAERHSAVESRRVLALPSGADLYLGVDAGGEMRGYQSRREQLDQLVTVLNVARSAPGMVVALKAHPAHPIDHLMPIVDAYTGANLVVLPRAAAVDHFLNAVDLVVTKYSTLILEAALWARCAVAALLDGDERFKVFGDLPAVVTSSAALQDLLARLASDAEARRTWLQTEQTRQAALLHRYYAETTGDPAAQAADAVLRHLGAIPGHTGPS